MESSHLCSEDGSNPAVCSCFCGFPLPKLCEGCLVKHPMYTEHPIHFHLPVYAGQCIASPQVKIQYRGWLNKLHSAYLALKVNDEYMTRFKEQLEATRQEAQHQFVQELNTRCAAAHELLSNLHQGFKDQLQNSFREAVAHSMEQWTPEAASLANLIWNYDGVSPLMVFRGWAGKTKERLTEVFRIYMEISLPAFAHFNIDEFGQQEDVESIRNELAAAKKQIEDLRNENGELTTKNDELQGLCMKLNEQLAGLEKKARDDESKKDELTTKNDELQGRCMKLNEQLAGLEKKARDDENKKDVLTKKSDELQTCCTKLKEELARLGEKARDEENTKNALTKKSDELQTCCTKLKEELARLGEKARDEENTKNALTKKSDELQTCCTKLKKELAELTTTKETELKRLTSEKEALKSESAAHTKRLTEQMNAQTAEIKRLSDELERVRHLSVIPPQQDGHILPQVFGARLRKYDLLTGRTTEASLAITFTPGTVFCLWDEDTLLCAGGGDYINPAVSSAYLLSLSTAELTAVPSMKTARGYPGIVKHGSHTYVFGGYNGFTALTACEKFNGKWTSLPDMKCRRWCFSSCVFGEKIYLAEVNESGRVLETFNVSREKFKTHVVQLPEWKFQSSVSFIVEGELILIANNGQMAKWRIDVEHAFRVSPIDLHGESPLSNVPLMLHGREVFWAQCVNGNLMKFGLETQLFTAL